MKSGISTSELNRKFADRVVFLRWSLSRSPLKKQFCPRARILYLLLKQLVLQYLFYERRRVFFKSFPFHEELLKEVPSFQGHKKIHRRKASGHIVDLRSNLSRDNSVSVQCGRYCSLPPDNISLTLTEVHESTSF